MTATKTSTVGKMSLMALQALAASLIESGRLNWRCHGIGVLQAYVHEGTAAEARIHVWSPRLMLPGIHESGSAHNHRFALTSTVLLGRLRHTEWRLQTSPKGGFETYDFVHARLHTDENRADMRPTGDRFAVDRHTWVMKAGMAYRFPRGAFHDSYPEDFEVVTFVVKTDQVDERAMVIAPVGLPPVAAFGGGEPDPALVALVLSLAAARLRREVER